MGDTVSHRGLRLIADAVLLASVLAAVACSFIRSLPAGTPAQIELARALGAAALLIFTLEYAVRLWIAPEQASGRNGPMARLDYARSFLGVIDLIVILPGWLALLLPVSTGLIELVDLLALLKLARFAPALGLVGTVLRNEARSLVGALMAMVVLLVLAAGVMYLLERNAQPQLFDSIPHTLWWAIVTMASVGYGDMVPATAAGRVFGGIIMLLGIAIFAVPTGILATGFAQEIRRRDFTVSWQAVAGVPLFAGLDAPRIASITRLLKPQSVPRNYTIVRRGDPADAMFFILRGAVEVELIPQPVKLGPGQFFGEIALVKDTTRLATVTAIQDTQLLALEVNDFRRLMAQLPDLKTRIEAVVEERLQTLEEAVPKLRNADKPQADPPA
ncbi:cyclic nucleotide-binding protein [Hypericibacter adhaerens]|uniref:Cyclic nucleotide-binding protein n=2 Tax=Hypericibacter adhaerens TaxID=2602016 RepID=A0A5J6N3B3_9PROT|nr:cyclic nucleotide-binding protein [Hypericibacter adhaerens]